MTPRVLRAFAVGIAMPLLAVAQPQTSTSGPCSPIGVSGGSAEVRCTFEAPAPKRAKVVIKNAWLRPSPGFMMPRTSHSNELALLTLVVRNLSEKDILLTAAKLEVIGAKGVVLQGSAFGDGTLQRSIGDTKPVRVPAGQTAEVGFGDSIVFPGLLERIETSIDTERIMVIEGLKPPRSNGDEFSQQLARLIADNYGRNAYLRASLFTEDYRLLQSFKIPLGKSASFFYDGERLDKTTDRHVFEPLISYDAFLGCYLKLKEMFVPEFRIAETPQTCIDVIPDESAPFGHRYRPGVCQEKKKEAPSRRLAPGC